MKAGVDTLQGIQYELHMMGIPIDGAKHIYIDSMSVVSNTSKPESVLQRKNNTICDYAVPESVEMKESLTACIDGNENPTDLLTIVLWGGKLVRNILNDSMMVNSRHKRSRSMQVYLHPSVSTQDLREQEQNHHTEGVSMTNDR